MVGIATPDTKQSEAYAATSTLFHLFSNNSREEKVGLRLPPAWRDLWSEMIEVKKGHADAQDRLVVKDLRAIVRQRRDQELEDGVILQGAFRGRNNKTASDTNEGAGVDRSKNGNANAGLYKKIWADKANSPKYQAMLVW